MGHKQKSKPFIIATVNVYNNTSYTLIHNTLAPLKNISHKSNYFYTAYLANKDMIIAPIEVAAGIEDDDIEGMLEDRAYEELGLDPAQEYIIHHQEIESKESQGKVFQLFVIEKGKYAELFQPLREKIKYIDLIIPAPLLYRSLYDSGTISPKGVQVFLYFTHYDTFVTFYKNGKYLYSKSIPFSLSQIYDHYCEMSGEAVDESKFFEVLQKDGLKALHSDFQQNLMKLFGEIFVSINDIVIYTKRAYDIDVIDQMYIGSELGPIAGLDKYVQNYLGFHSTPLEFDLGIRTEERQRDQLHYLLAVSSKEYQSQPDDLVNFTLYPRPPTLFKRPVGQIAALSLAALIFATAMPVYDYVSAKMNNVQTLKLREQEKILANDVADHKRIIKKKKEEYDNIKKVVKDLSVRFIVKEKILRKIHDKKVNYHLKSDQLVMLGKDLLDYGVKMNNIRTHMNNYSISLVSPDDKAITELIKKISEKYYGDIRSIDIKKIEKDQNSTFYNGILKVQLK